MKPPDFSKSVYASEIKTALAAAKAAGEYLKNHRDDVQIKEYKEGMHNYATNQDLESERMIIEILKEQFPDDMILAEETSNELTSTNRLWIVDPLDGTRNFRHGLPHFSISIAFYDKGTVQLGVIYAPCSNNELFYALKGYGAYMNDCSLKMKNPGAELAASIVSTGFTYFRDEELTHAIKTYEDVLNHATDVVRYGSAALEICLVAIGRLGVYYETGLKPWDIAAGKLILQESGGIATDYCGKTINLFRTINNNFNVQILAVKNKEIMRSMVYLLNKQS